MTAAMFFTQVLRQTRVAIAERHCRGAGGDTTPRLQGAGGYRSTAANVADAANCSSTHAGEEGIGITQGSRDLASRGEDTRRQRLSTHSALALPTAAADMRGGGDSCRPTYTTHVSVSIPCHAASVCGLV